MWEFSNEKEEYIYLVFCELTEQKLDDFSVNRRRLSNIISDYFAQYPSERNFVQTAILEGVFSAMIEAKDADITLQRIKIAQAEDRMVNIFRYDEYFAKKLLALFAKSINLTIESNTVNNSAFLSKLDNMSDIELFVYQQKNLYSDIWKRIENLPLTKREYELLLNRFERNTSLEIYKRDVENILKILTEELLIEWRKYEEKNLNSAIEYVFSSKVCGTGVVLKCIVVFEPIGNYSVKSYIKIQQPNKYNLVNASTLSKENLFRCISDIYPEYKIQETILKGIEKSKKAYLDSLGPLERFLEDMVDTVNVIQDYNEKFPSYLQNYTGNRELHSLNNRELENIIIDLTKNNVLKWKEYSVEEIKDGYEGTYYAKFGKEPIGVKFQLLYRTEKSATIKVVYFLLNTDYKRIAQKDGTRAREVREIIQENCDKFTLYRKMRIYMNKKNELLCMERQKKQKEEKQRKENEKIEAIPKFNLDNLFIASGLEGFEQKSLYELFYDDRKKFYYMRDQKKFIIDKNAMVYLEQGKGKKKDPIIAQLQLHGQYDFKISEKALEQAIERNLVIVENHRLYSNTGWEYQTIRFGNKEIFSTKDRAGKRGL